MKNCAVYQKEWMAAVRPREELSLVFLDPQYWDIYCPNQYKPAIYLSNTAIIVLSLFEENSAQYYIIE